MKKMKGKNPSACANKQRYHHLTNFARPVLTSLLLDIKALDNLAGSPFLSSDMWI